MWRPEDPQGNESAKIKYEIVPYTRGRGLDLGCGMYKCFPHFIGVDNYKQWGKLSPADEYGLKMNVDIRCDCEKLEPFANQSMDFVFSSHLLEHVEDPQAVLAEWWRVIKHNGYLVLYLPHADFYPNVGEEGANPDHKHDFKPQDIIQMMKEVGYWDLVRSENRSQPDDNEYSFLQVYQKSSDKEWIYSASLEKEEQKTCAIVRYGAFGDMIQMSSILPHLKNQGYHVTVFSTPTGQEILKSDPHIDEFVIQDTDQVPNDELVPYWECWEKKYDKWINLSESVEGTFLALPGRTFYMWPQRARHDLLNVNYLEFTHILAGVPNTFGPKFYPTGKEKRWAEKQRRKIDGRVILWALDGSSVHKHWPWTDNAFARILTSYPDIKIVTVGNELSSLLEVGWENEPRVITKSGKWSIRNTLSLALKCDMVIGPETGVMNAVSMTDIPKILFLSHSSAENISKHWVNCSPLAADHGCRTCHKMIYGWDNCSRKSLEVEFNDKKLIEGAECQVNITLEQFWRAFKANIKE
jgi:ADP-heptose:LPS heptosyltransferase